MAFPPPCPSRQTVRAGKRDIFLPCGERWVVSLSAPRLSPAYLPGRDAVLSRQPGTPLPSGPAHLVFFLTHNLIRCAGFSAWALCPFFPLARARRDSAPDLILVESKRLLSAIGGRCRVGARDQRCSLRHINNADARPISRRSQVQPSCLRASDLSTVITEALNA